MSLTIHSIASAAYIPLSAEYSYDGKIDLQPTLFQYEEGFSFFHHPLFEGAKDATFANESFFVITSSVDLRNMIEAQTNIDPSELVLFTGLLAENGKYISNRDNTLFATGTGLGPSEFFRIIRNGNGTYSITQSGLYATVDLDNNKFTVKMQDKIEPDSNNLQSFMFYSGGSPDKFTIKSLFTVTSWAPFVTAPVERFWSWYDGNGTDVVRTNGLIVDDDYVDVNPYLFTSTVDLQLFVIGFDGKIVWVKYYNEFLDKFFNKTVDIKEVIDGVEQNFLIEYPYKTKTELTNYTEALKTGKIKINMMNLKSIMTPEYNYHRKTDQHMVSSS